MDNHNKINSDNEIEFKELFLNLWYGKVFILCCTIVCVFLASLYLHKAKRVYLVEYKLKPVGEVQQKSAFSGLGGFASLAGIQLPTNSSNDFKIFKELISSVEVSEIIFKNENLMKKIYKNEWNSSLNRFSEPSKSKFRAYISILKNILTGNNEVSYIPPDARRLSNYISNNISIKEDKGTGFLSIKAEASKPYMLSSLISIIIETSDQIMRQRYINFSKEPLAFYKEKLRTARSREHREALAELISKEEQKLMFASRGKYFIAEPYINPTISLHPTAPKPKLILALSLILGLFLGATFILVRHAITKEN
jgi:LPS O-antigen subunit length determinant protein (WzzB/FepE family)